MSGLGYIASNSAVLWDRLEDGGAISDIIRRIADVAEEAILVNGGAEKMGENGEIVSFIKTDS